MAAVVDAKARRARYYYSFTTTICLAFASLAAWAFGRVGRFLVADAARYQAFYEQAAMWLDSHGVEIAGLWAEHFNVGWLLRAMQYFAGRANSMLSFWLIAIVYVVLGLIEIDDIRQRIEKLEEQNRRARAAGGQRGNRR